MQSQGSTSSQPSFDSLSSSDSLLFSDSEQAEDDADVFLTDGSSSVIIGRADEAAAASGDDRVSESPGSQWACDGFTDKEEDEESERAGRDKPANIDAGDGTAQSQKSQGDLLFAQKCAELQGFVRPLLELLNGLKRGRFDRGLSSFQQSVAMDRIQRIVGVLQRPNSGEKYLNTLLQVEVMLKLWFPQIPTLAVSSASRASASPQRSVASPTPPHKHRDQLHMPVKKRRLSWTGTDSPASSPGLHRSPRVGGEEKRAKHEGGGRPAVGVKGNVPDVADDRRVNNNNVHGKDGEGAPTPPGYKAGQSSEPSLTWVHVAPISSPGKSCPSHEGAAAAAANGEERPAGAVQEHDRRRSPATQDSSVSSTTPRQDQRKPVRCQSQPVAGQQSEGEREEARRGRSPCPHVTVKPLPRVGRTPVET